MKEMEYAEYDDDSEDFLDFDDETEELDFEKYSNIFPLDSGDEDDDDE